jgi:hypothetical protein
MTILAILCALGAGFVGIVVWRGATWKERETHEDIVKTQNIFFEP